MPEKKDKTYPSQFDKVKEITDKLEAGIQALFESEAFKNYLKTLSNRRTRRKPKRPKGPDDFTGQSHLSQGAVVRLFAFQRSARTRSHHEVMILTGLGAAPTRSSGRTISVKTEIDPDRNTARQVVKRAKMASLDVYNRQHGIPAHIES